MTASQELVVQALEEEGNVSNMLRMPFARVREARSC